MAELWFGAHPSGPATVLVDKQPVGLDKLFSKQPEMVGAVELYKKYKQKLPFLFKILSVAMPLSLQAHPDKNLASILHQKDPTNYPDSNHKPELAIALTQFEVLCDFRPISEIVHFVNVLHPLRRVVGEKESEQLSSFVSLKVSQDKQQAALAQCFKNLMISEKEKMSIETKKLLTNLEYQKTLDANIFALVKELDKLYPGDPGVLAPFFLNYLKLDPGQAIYLKPNKLHAYIRGECIECMSSSDNVVRAGLTTKFRDVKTLLNMLDYRSVKHSNEVLFDGTQLGDQSVSTYAPIDEFKVDKVIVSDIGDYNLKPVSSGSFIIVMEGRATARDFFNPNIDYKLTLGSAGFIPPKIALKLSNIQSRLTLYRAYC